MPAFLSLSDAASDIFVGRGRRLLVNNVYRITYNCIVVFKPHQKSCSTEGKFLWKYHAALAGAQDLYASSQKYLSLECQFEPQGNALKIRCERNRNDKSIDQISGCRCS